MCTLDLASVFRLGMTIYDLTSMSRTHCLLEAVPRAMSQFALLPGKADALPDHEYAA